MDSTAEYVHNSFKSRERTVAKMFRKLDAGRKYEGQDPSEALSEFPLSVETKTHVIILLGTGGPHDEIDCEVSKGQHGGYELDAATHGCYWGGEKRETRLTPTDALWRYAEYMIEGMGE